MIELLTLLECVHIGNITIGAEFTFSKVSRTFGLLEALVLELSEKLLTNWLEIVVRDLDHFYYLKC